MQSTYVVKTDGTKELFHREKLISSLVNAGASQEIAEGIASHIEVEIKDGMSTREIYKHAFFLLRKKYRKAAIKYSLRAAVSELGPTGFPFEKFIAEIFKAKGYETRTGEIVMGSCVAHEVDVVAWNENKLIMCEAKFHNKIGFKSDMKVVLYVKSRFDDLKESQHNYGKVRSLDEGWLITNTKFTTTAIHYAECKGLKLVGWNYPAKGNLQDLIEDGAVHPVTCLTTLTKHQRVSLLSQNIVLCRQLIAQSEVLKNFGMSDAKINTVLQEIALLGQ